MITHFSAMIYIILFLQQDAQTWEQLLHTSGGKLEIQKCVFAIFNWHFDQWGRFILNHKTDCTRSIRSSDTNKQSIIPQLKTPEAYKYVGVQIAPDGNMKAQIQDLQKKCNIMCTIFAQTYFNANDANQGYMTVFAPAVKYVLPVTSISTLRLRQMQSRIVSTVLSRLRFNKHMPRHVVFSTKSKGGLGLLNLPSEQGSSQIQTTYLSSSIQRLTGQHHQNTPRNVPTDSGYLRLPSDQHHTSSIRTIPVGTIRSGVFEVHQRENLHPI
jgi:hypothetical protein